MDTHTHTHTIGFVSQESSDYNKDFSITRVKLQFLFTELVPEHLAPSGFFESFDTQSLLRQLFDSTVAR